MKAVSQAFRQDLDELDSGSEESDEESAGPENNVKREKRSSEPPSDADIDTEVRKQRLRINAFSSSNVFVDTISKIKAVEANESKLNDPKIYDLVMKSNSLIFSVDTEMFEIYRIVVDLFSPKFPELSNIVTDFVRYAKAVKLIGNEVEVASIDFKDVLPQASVMAISLTNISQEPLNFTTLETINLACDKVIYYDNAKRNILLPFVSSRIEQIAPNVSALVGAEIAALLLGLTDGLDSLSKIPAGNILLLGKSDTMISGFSKVNAMRNTGIIYHSELVQNTEPEHRRKALRTVAGRLALCARIDANLKKKSTTANVRNMGEVYYEEIKQKSEKWATPNPGKTLQALPDPEPKKRTRRGGRRMRKRKEMLAQSEMHKQLNRVGFADTGDEYADSAMGDDLGMLGSSKNRNSKFGKMRVVQKERKFEAKMKKFEQDSRNGKLNLTQKFREQLKGVSASNSGTITSGLASSVAMTPYQGMELINPDLKKEQLKKANEKWFGKNFNFDEKRLAVDTSESKQSRTTKKQKII